MTDFLALAERWGWWAVLVAYGVVKIAPIVVNKLWPEWMAAQRDMHRLESEADKLDREAVVRVYDKFVVSLESMIKFVGSATTAINGMERALDSNTRTLAEMVESVKRGPRCPLPDCPYWGDEGTRGGEDAETRGHGE